MSQQKSPSPPSHTHTHTQHAHRHIHVGIHAHTHTHTHTHQYTYMPMHAGIFMPMVTKNCISQQLSSSLCKIRSVKQNGYFFISSLSFLLNHSYSLLKFSYSTASPGCSSVKSVHTVPVQVYVDVVIFLFIDHYLCVCVCVRVLSQSEPGKGVYPF